MENVKLIDASPKGTVTFEFLIDERYTNINGVMHGGAAGVIFDMCTTTALGPLARPGYWECDSSLFILKCFCSKL
jgi:acyl-coenzyme A thioesterase 13